MPSPLRAIQPLTAVLLAALVLVALSLHTTAADPPQTHADLAPEIAQPYAAGSMPAADEILEICHQKFAQSKSWSAQSRLAAFAADPHDADIFAGNLYAEGDTLSADLVSESSTPDDTEHDALHLRDDVSGDAARAWFERRRGTAEPAAATGEELDRRLARIAPLSELFLFGLPGQPDSAAQWLTPHHWTNLGISESSTGKCYALQATPPETETTVAVAGYDASQLLLFIDLATGLPAAATFVAGEGEDRSAITVRFDDFHFDDDARPLPRLASPPDGALVVDLTKQPAPADETQNPVPYDAASIARGKRLYLADCVGTGRDSDVADNAADLTDTEYWLSDGTPYDTFLAIRDGAGDEMPGYKDDYRDEKPIWDLVNYIRSLQEPD